MDDIKVKDLLEDPSQRRKRSLLLSLSMITKLLKKLFVV